MGSCAGHLNELSPAKLRGKLAPERISSEISTLVWPRSNKHGVSQNIVRSATGQAKFMPDLALTTRLVVRINSSLPRRPLKRRPKNSIRPPHTFDGARTVL